MTLSARALLDRLVGFPTVSRDSNLDLIDFVEEYLDDYGVKATRVPNEDGTKAALYAHVGPEVDGGIVLSGHTDVVPVDGQAWDTDPFIVTERQGKLFGRGTCDMKGFDALALSAVPRALEKGIKRPLQIALSYDEEVGCTGAPPMIDHMVAMGMPRADTVLVGDVLQAYQLGQLCDFRKCRRRTRHFGCRFCTALHDIACGHDQWRNRTQYYCERLPFRVRFPHRPG